MSQPSTALALAAPLPPGPRGALSQMLRGARDPLGYYLGLERRYGDTLTLPTFQGPYVITSHPEGIKAILTADADTCAPSAFEALRELHPGQSLLLMGGAAHRAARKLMAPPFAGARMRAYGPVIRRIARARVAAWPRGAFSLQEKLGDISLDVIIATIFGVEDEAGMGRFRAAMLRWFEALRRAGPAMMWKALRRPLLGLSPWAGYLRARDALSALMQEQIDARRADPGERKDILSLLLAARDDDGAPMADVDIMGQLLTLTVAGTETTAILLAWATYELLRSPAALSRLREEVASLGADPDPEAVSRLPYLDAVLGETLRRWPGTLAVSRRLLRPLSVRGYALPAGTLVGAGLTVQLREDLYEDPLSFRPERMLDRAPSPFELLPFGGGHRRCIGAPLASYEAKLVLAEIIRDESLRLRTARPLRAVIRPLALGPEGGVPVLR